MTDPKHDCDLLAQRIDQLERSLSIAQDDVKSARSEIDKAAGRSGFVAFIAPMVLGVIGAVGAGVVWSGLTDAQSKAGKNALAVMELSKRVDAADADRADIHLRKQKLREEFEAHRDSDGHPRLDERVQTIEAQIADDNDWQDAVLREQTRIGGYLDRAHDFIKTNKDEIARTEELVNSNRNSIAAAVASIEVHNKEMDTQIRSAFEKIAEWAKHTDRFISILWQSEYDQELPDYDHTPSTIPAQATSTLGDIKTNGSK